MPAASSNFCIFCGGISGLHALGCLAAPPLYVTQQNKLLAELAEKIDFLTKEIERSRA